MRRSTSQRLWSSLRIGLVVSLAGCSIMPVKLTQEEITTRAAADHQHLADGQEPVAGPIDLYEAMARALKYNLEARVEFTHKALAETQLGLAHYNMLPRLAANAGFDGRNNFTGGVAQSLITGRQVLEPFTSAERNIFSADLALSWNVLDFGLSYVRAKQAADDVLIAEEERRRVANRVIQEVRNGSCPRSSSWTNGCREPSSTRRPSRARS
jgi:outer membrane protein, multidrug efflux system